MLTAKLFAALVALQLGLAVLESRAAQPSIDVLFHATYFVIGKIHLQILLALASTCFAVIYFVGSRSVTHPLNNTLGLAHFVLAMSPACVANFLESSPISEAGACRSRDSPTLGQKK